MKIFELISDNYYVIISLTRNNVKARVKRNSQRIRMTQCSGGFYVHAFKSATMVESGLSEWNGMASDI